MTKLIDIVYKRQLKLLIDYLVKYLHHYSLVINANVGHRRSQSRKPKPL